jgi:aromatic ring-opening dioxygenase catalytic subunit (LigB family)
MTIAFAAAISHAPGMVAWADAAPPNQKDALYTGLDRLRAELDAARVDEIILFTSEHWANFFLDHISPFCVGRGASFKGPIEPWLKLSGVNIQGDPDLATTILEQCYENGVEPGYAYELAFDHGTMIPLHFLRPEMDLPVVPIFFNTLASPQPSARRSLELGRIVGDIARASKKRIALIATGGMSHDPGERKHGWIDEAFDQRFLTEMVVGDLERLASYTTADLLAAGAGAVELLGWIALAGALGQYKGEIVAYEAVKPWATGIGLVSLTPDSAGVARRTASA